MVGWPTFRARTIRRASLFEEQASRIDADVRRFDEQLMGIEWAVAARAEVFPLIPLTTLRMAKTRPFPDAPALRVFFTVDDAHYCTLQAVEVIGDPAGDEDYPE